MLETKETKQLRKIVGKTKIDKIRSQQIKKSYSIQPLDERMERRRKWDEHVKQEWMLRYSLKS